MRCAAREIPECECPLEQGERRRLYVVTSHQGDEGFVRYCPECYELALIDWNRETAKVRLVDESAGLSDEEAVYVAHGRRAPAGRQ